RWMPSGVMERGSPVTVAGAARDSSPASLGPLASAGPASRAIRDVTRELNIAAPSVQLWHAARAADAHLTGPRYAPQAHDRDRHLHRTPPERFFRAAAAPPRADRPPPAPFAPRPPAGGAGRSDR